MKSSSGVFKKSNWELRTNLIWCVLDWQFSHTWCTREGVEHDRKIVMPTFSTFPTLATFIFKSNDDGEEKRIENAKFTLLLRVVWKHQKMAADNCRRRRLTSWADFLERTAQGSSPYNPVSVCVDRSNNDPTYNKPPDENDLLMACRFHSIRILPAVRSARFNYLLLLHWNPPTSLVYNNIPITFG